MALSRLLVLSAVFAVAVAVPGLAEASSQSNSTPTAVSPDGVSAYKLARHNAAVRYHRHVKMWDCWSSGVTPRFAAWNGSRWVRWSIGQVSTDVEKCPGPGKSKIVYSYYVSLKGVPVKNRAYHLVRVKEYCRGCETARWTLPVLPPGAAAGRATY
jgi:hypothetical protein